MNESNNRYRKRNSIAKALRRSNGSTFDVSQKQKPVHLIREFFPAMRIETSDNFQSLLNVISRELSSEVK